MTATPIPRTLALAGYGDLEVSRLRELPRGRQAIATRIVAGDGARERAYEELREQLRAGRQGYVVCPLVEEAREVRPTRPAPYGQSVAGESGSTGAPDTPGPGPSIASESGITHAPGAPALGQPVEARQSTEVGASAAGVVGELRAATAEYERLAKSELEGYSWCCCTAGCARVRSRRRWRGSPRARRTCWLPRR